MGKKQHRQNRRAPQPAAKGGPAPAVNPDSEIQKAHAEGAWGKVIALWQQATKHTGSRQVPDPELAALAAEAHDQHGMSLYRKGNLTAAAAHFHNAVALSPDRATYHYHLALAHHRSCRWPDAVAGYQAALRIAPNDRRAAYHLCLACLQSGLECQPGGALDAALATLQQQAEGDSIPWEVRRLQAWQEYVRTGSIAALVALHGAERRPEPPLALEAAVVTLASGKAEAARRRLPDPVDAPADPFSVCVEGVRAILSARAGHHHQAAAAGDRLLGARPLPRDPHGDVARSVRTRALWEAGLAVWQNGEPTAAAKYWEEALEADPRSTSLRLNVALALLAGRSPEAGRHWLELARTWERSAGRKEAQDAPSQRLAAGLAYHRAGEARILALDFREARRLLERAITLAPGNVDILYDLAHLAGVTGDDAWLRREARHLLELLRDDADRLSDVGHLLEETGLSADAEPVWLRLLELNAQHECARDHLVSLYEEQGKAAWEAGRLEDARSCFVRGVALAPGPSRLHTWLGGIHLVLGDRQRAEEAFAQGQESEDESALAYAEVAVGRQLLKEGLRRDAEAAFQRGLDACDCADTRLEIGLAYLSLNLLQPALREFRKAVHAPDGDTDLLLTVADALNRNGAHAEAQDLILEALAERPEDHRLWTMRAITEFNLSGLKMDRSIARKARLLALHQGDSEAVRILDEMLSMI